MAIRQNSKILKGDQLWLFVAKESGEDKTALPVAFASNCSLNRSLSTNSISSKDHGSSSYVTPGEGSWTASTEALMSINVDTGAVGYENCMDLLDENEIVCVTFGYVKGGSTEEKYPSGQNIVDIDDATNWVMSDPYWEGKGYITTLNATGNHGDAATYSIEITGIGALKKHTVAGTGN